MSPAASRNPLSRVPRAAMVYGLGDAVGRAIYVLALPVLTRAMTPTEFGISVGVMAYAQAVSLLMQLNLAASLIRFHSDAPDEESRRLLVSTLIWFNVAWSVALTIVLNWF